MIQINEVRRLYAGSMYAAALRKGDLGLLELLRLRGEHVEDACAGGGTLLVVNDYFLDARTSLVKFDVALADDICRYYLLGLILSIIINDLLIV